MSARRSTPTKYGAPLIREQTKVQLSSKIGLMLRAE
jgi:hypothetical protein